MLNEENHIDLIIYDNIFHNTMIINKMLEKHHIIFQHDCAGAEIGLGAKMGSAMCLVSEIGMGSGSESASELEDEKGTERAGRMG